MRRERRPDDPMTLLAGHIRLCREEHGWSQAELAEVTGLSRPTIARIERGDDVSTDSLFRVLDALEIALIVG